MKEVMKMLHLLQMAYKEISYEAREGERTDILGEVHLRASEHE